jgi:hypothetical protein
MCDQDKATGSYGLCDEVVAKAEEIANEMGTTLDALEDEGRWTVVNRLWNEAAIEVHGGEEDR